MIGAILLLIGIVLIALAFYKWATLNNDFFERRNIKYVKPTFFIGSTAGVFFKKYTAVEFAQKVYQSFPNESIYGLFEFRSPQYVIRDPELYKQITIKDFEYFEDHRGFSNTEIVDQLWDNSLFFMKGQTWRQMRATLSPAFTGSKMRLMFDLVAECADGVSKHFSTKAANGEQINIEMKDFFSRYTNDIIASCAFGLKVNSFTDPDNEFFLNGKSVTDFSSVKALTKLFLVMNLTSLAKLLNIQLVEKRVAAVFKSTIFDTMKFRKLNNVHRPDMINIMMQVRDGTLKHLADEKKENEGFATVDESEIGKMAVNRVWNDDEIVAQCFLFFVGGFDTSSTLLTFAAYELMLYPDIQQKLYEEIEQTNEQLDGRRITYDVLQKMKYLDQVICETLRKWPPFLQLDRICVKDYVYDNGDDTKLKIEKGAMTFCPIYGFHHDPKYFPEPERFDPERFSDENKKNIQPGTYLPFGNGPRNCIGSRFALMGVKAALYYILLKFSFEPNQITQIPLKLEKIAFSLSAENGVHLELKPRKL